MQKSETKIKVWGHLDPVKVRAWLAEIVAVDPDRVIGRANCQMGCPLSEYLAEQGVPNVAIGNIWDMSTFQVMRVCSPTGEWVQLEWHPLPVWGVDYAQGLDAEAPWGDDEDNEPEYSQPSITAALALSVLDNYLANRSDQEPLMGQYCDDPKPKPVASIHAQSGSLSHG